VRSLVTGVEHGMVSPEEALKILKESTLEFEEVSSLNTTPFEMYCRDPDSFIIDYETGEITKVK